MQPKNVMSCKFPAKQSQHANATYCNIVGRNLLHAFGHPVTCCDVLGVVGSNLTIFKPAPAKPNMSQHGGQTHAACCTQQCCDMLHWHAAIVWPGLKGVGHVIFNLHLGVGHSVLCQMERVGHAFSNHHILKCSGPPPVLFDQSLKADGDE